MSAFGFVFGLGLVLERMGGGGGGACVGSLRTRLVWQGGVGLKDGRRGTRGVEGAGSVTGC